MILISVFVINIVLLGHTWSKDELRNFEFDAQFPGGGQREQTFKNRSGFVGQTWEEAARDFMTNQRLYRFKSKNCIKKWFSRFTVLEVEMYHLLHKENKEFAALVFDR